MIPQFKNTREALEYGQSIASDSQKIEELRLERERLSKEVRRLISLGEDEKALYLASGQSQFVREAMEEALRIQVGRNLCAK